MVENMVVFTLGTEISELKITTGSLVGSLPEIEARAVGTKKNLENAQENVSVSHSHQKTSTDEDSSLTEELLSVCVKRANLRADLDDITAPMGRTKNAVGRSLCNVSTEVQKAYVDTIWAPKLNIQADHVDR